MRKELAQKLAGRWPGWFNLEGDVRYTLMSFGFCHGDGWFGILWRLCEDLEPLATEVEKQTGHPFEVLQVKEKLGGLRFYVNHRSNTVCRRIEAAALESFASCEVCGQPGKRREGGWIKTLCAKHASAHEAEI